LLKNFLPLYSGHETEAEYSVETSVSSASMLCVTLPNVRHVTKCASHYQMFVTLPNVRHVTKCASHYQMCVTLPNVRHITKCASRYQMCVTLPNSVIRIYETNKKIKIT